MSWGADALPQAIFVLFDFSCRPGEGGRSKGGKEGADVSEDIAMLEPEPPLDIADEIDMDFTFHSPKALGQWQEDIKDSVGYAYLCKSAQSR